VYLFVCHLDHTILCTLICVIGVLLGRRVTDKRC